MPISHRFATTRSGFTLIELLMVITVAVALMATFVVVGMNYYKVAAKRQKAEQQIAAYSGYLEGYGKKRWTVNPGSDDSNRPQVSFMMWDLPMPSGGLTKNTVTITGTTDTKVIYTSNAADWDPDNWGRYPTSTIDPVTGALVTDNSPTSLSPSSSRRMQGDGILDGQAFRDSSGNVIPFESIVVEDGAGDDYSPFIGYSGFALMNRMDIREKETDPQTGELLDPWGQPYRIMYFDQGDTTTFGNPAVNPFGTQPWGIYSLGPDGVDNTIDAPTSANQDDVRSWEFIHDDA